MLDIPALLDEPFEQFQGMVGEEARTEPNHPNAMTLATSTPDAGRRRGSEPLKGSDTQRLRFQQYQSRSGQLARTPGRRCCSTGNRWGARRIEGGVEAVSEAESDSASCLRISRLGAWASDQSRPLPDRAELERRLAECEARYSGDSIPRPPHWSGYRVRPSFSNSGRTWPIACTIGRSTRCTETMLDGRARLSVGWRMTIPPETGGGRVPASDIGGRADRRRHISLVVLGADTAWKLRKAVRLPFLDCTALDARRRFAFRELELNAQPRPVFTVTWCRSSGGRMARSPSAKRVRRSTGWSDGPRSRPSTSWSALPSGRA